MKPENLKADIGRLWQELAKRPQPSVVRQLTQLVLLALAPTLQTKAAYFKHTYARNNPVVDADDLVQDASIAVLDALTRAPKQGELPAPLAYLLTAADYAMLKGAFAGAKGEISLDDLPDNIPQLMFEWSDSADTKVILDAAARTLPEPLEQVVRFRYWDCLTQAETAKRMGLSRPRITQLEKQALTLLKSTLTI